MKRYVKASNPVSEGLPNYLDSFLQDLSQIYGGISYSDIMELGSVWTMLPSNKAGSIKRYVNAIKSHLEGYSGDIFELAEEDVYFKQLCDDLIDEIKRIIENSITTVESATVLASDEAKKWYGELLSDDGDIVGQEYGSSYEEVKQKLNSALKAYLAEYEDYDEDEKPDTSEFRYIIKEVLSFRQAVDAVKEIIDPYYSYKRQVEDAESLFDEDDYWLDEIDWYDVCYAASEEVEEIDE